MTSIPQNPVLSATRPLDMAAAATVVLLCLSWGLNQVAVKLALPDIPPLMQASIRSAGAGADRMAVDAGTRHSIASR